MAAPTRPAKRTAAKRPARKTVAPAPVVAPDDVDGINLDLIEVPAPAEREHLFTLNGIRYSFDPTPRAGMALKYLKLSREQGVDGAYGWVLEQCIGSDAYDALSEWNGLTGEILERLANIVISRVIDMDQAGSASGPLGRG